MGRLGGEVARTLRAPPVVGELLAGVLLGPTVLGHLGVTDWLFPASGPARVGLDAIRVVSVSCLLLVAGLEIDLGVMRRLGRTAISTGIGSLVVPFAIGLAAGMLAPGVLGRPAGVPETAFGLFIGVALAISALPVIARILLDLNLIKTDVGIVVLASAMLDDLFGWLVFSIVLGLVGSGGERLPVGYVFLGTLAFAAAVLGPFRLVLDRVLPWVQARAANPVAIVGPVLALGLLGAAATEALGTHAVIGAFLVGAAIRTEDLREHAHEVVHQFVTTVFAPLYFATVALRVDFAASFSPGLVALVLVLACLGKLVGATFGARLSGRPLRESLAIASGLNARGAMAIVLAELALQAGLVEKPLFTAIIFMALATSVMSGPLMRWLLRPAEARPTLLDLLGERVVLPLSARSAREAIEELARLVAPAAGVAIEKVSEGAWQREQALPTGLGLEVAVPHVRLDGARTVLALGIAPHGIDFDAPDGRAAKIVFLIVTPTGGPDAQLQILRDIGHAFEDEARRSRVLGAEDVAAVTAALVP